MREIKLKVVDARGDEPIVADVVEIQFETEQIAYWNEYHELEWIGFDEAELLQFTGLKDKNGKDLDWWEGDIIKDTRPYTQKKEGYFEIVYKQGCFWLKSIHGTLCLTCECLTTFLHIFEKVGTIHTTPNLMEKENA